jgi:hypothetical protein
VAITQTLAQLRSGTRKFADVQGTSALVRHPDADLNDYVNRGIAALRRELDVAIPDQRFLASSSVSLTAGTSTYALPADFNALISVGLVADGARSWLVAYEMHEHASLTDPSASFRGVPFAYRLRGSNIDFLPVPQASYTATVWYVSDPSTLSSDASTLDTITRLDDYVIAYAAKLVAVKDKNFDLVAVCDGVMDRMRDDVQFIARSRDRNAPSRIVDESMADRWGRPVRRYR